MPNYREVKPVFNLQNIIDCFWFNTLEDDSEQESSSVMIPDNRVDIVFLRDIKKQSEIHFVGPMSKSFKTVPREIRGIRFKAEYLKNYFHIPMCDFNDCIVPLEEIYPDTNKLIDINYNSNSPEEFIHSFSEYFCLQNQMENLNPNYNILKISTAIENGVSVSDIQEQSSFSRQYLLKLFRSNVGISMKRFERISRLQRAITSLRGQIDLDWSDFALAHGYYDQSHLINECKELTGRTPTLLIG